MPEVTINYDNLLKPTDVARIFNVDQKTVYRWAKAGKIKYLLTPGNTMRFRETEVRALLEDQ